MYISFHSKVQLVNNSIYEWHVKIIKVDEDSLLFLDLKSLKEKNGCDHILVSFTFKDNFPFSPPFVRVIHPVLHGGTGFVTRAGAVCMELLTPEGWSAGYSIEAIIIQLMVTLVQGEARINFEAVAEDTYTLLGAEFSYKRLVGIHSANGWDKNPKPQS